MGDQHPQREDGKVLTIYLDFDGTVVEHAYPELGALLRFRMEIFMWFFCIK